MECVGDASSSSTFKKKATEEKDLSKDAVKPTEISGNENSSAKKDVHSESKQEISSLFGEYDSD